MSAKRQSTCYKSGDILYTESKDRWNGNTIQLKPVQVQINHKQKGVLRYNVKLYNTVQTIEHAGVR